MHYVTFFVSWAGLAYLFFNNKKSYIFGIYKSTQGQVSINKCVGGVFITFLM